MTKKFMSLVLMMALLVGLLPVMSVQAETAETNVFYVNDDFESYDCQVFSAGAALSKNGVETWKAQSATTCEIVSVEGYDGKTTKALKYSSNEYRENASSNTYRLYAQTFSEADANALAGKIFVQEAKVWVPANEMSEDGKTIVDRKRPNQFYLGYGIRISGDKICAGTTKIVTETILPSEQWVEIRIVIDYTNYTSTTSLKNYTVYADGVCIAKGASKDVINPGKSLKYSMISYTGNDPAGTYDDIHFLVDDVKFYHTPATVYASSNKLAGSTQASTKVSPVIEFNDKILEYAAHSDGEIYASKNIVFEKVADSSAVAVNDLVVSADAKSLTIDPVNELEPGTEYSITVQNLHDIYGRLIESYTFTFKTAEPSAIEITAEPSLTKVNPFSRVDADTPIATLENGYIQANYTIRNKALSEKNALMLVVLKDSGTISAFQFEEVSLAAGDSHTFTGAFDVKDAANQSVEFYVWDSITGMTDLATSYKITTSGSSVITTVE